MYVCLFVYMSEINMNMLYMCTYMYVFICVFIIYVCLYVSMYFSMYIGLGTIMCSFECLCNMILSQSLRNVVKH
jgi:hypothetical protein